MDLQTIGRSVLVLGIVLAILGAILMLLGRVPFLNLLGSLPGDIQVRSEGFTCFVPIVSMILISIILTVVLNIIIRFINRP